MSPVERLQLIREVFEAVYRETDSFLNATGGQLAYLFAAIANHVDLETVELDALKDEELIALLDMLFSEDHQIWEFVDISPLDGTDRHAKRTRKLYRNR